MHLLSSDPASRAALAHDIHKLERLLVDLKSLAAGAMPSEKTLAGSPLLDLYQVRSGRDLFLTGICVDHPKLFGPAIFTSSLWVVAPDHSWVRTYSRFYRLGRPLSEDGSNAH
jgi:hypothetical protein